MARRWGLTALVGVLVLCAGCTNPRKGQVMVAVQADMSIPRDIDAMRLKVSVNGVVHHEVEYALGANGQRLPGTLALVAGSRPDPVTVEVASKRRGRWQTVRRAVIGNIPQRETITAIHLPIQWLCTGEDSLVDGASAASDPESACGEGEACVAGACVPNEVDAMDLPEFSEEEVFGGVLVADEAQEDAPVAECFDTLGCFEDGRGVTNAEFDPLRCAITSIDADSLNVGMVVPRGGGGICSDDETAPCIVPLDRDEAAGWHEADGDVILPFAVCRRIADGRVTGLAVTSACATKGRSNATCGAWSAVGTEEDATTDARTPLGVVDLGETPIMDVEDAGPSAVTPSDFMLLSNFTDGDLSAGETGGWSYLGAAGRTEPSVVTHPNGQGELDYNAADANGAPLVMALDQFVFGADDFEIAPFDVGEYNALRFNATSLSLLAAPVTLDVAVYTPDQISASFGGDCEDVTEAGACPPPAWVAVTLPPRVIEYSSYTVTFAELAEAAMTTEGATPFDPSNVVGFAFSCTDPGFVDDAFSVGIDDVGLVRGEFVANQPAPSTGGALVAPADTGAMPGAGTGMVSAGGRSSTVGGTPGPSGTVTGGTTPGSGGAASSFAGSSGTGTTQTVPSTLDQSFPGTDAGFEHVQLISSFGDGTSTKLLSVGTSSVCFEGTLADAALVTDAGVGFGLQLRSLDVPFDASLEGISSVTFQLIGDVGSALSIGVSTFVGAETAIIDGVVSGYLTGPGEYTVTLSDLYVPDFEDGVAGAPLDQSDIDSLQFAPIAASGTETEFDFCVTGVTFQ